MEALNETRLDDEARAETGKDQEENVIENQYEGSLCFKKLKTPASISSTGEVEPSTGKTNYLNNRKYTWYSFIPIILYNQFSFFFNLYFLLLCITQLIPALKVGFLVTYIGPLLFVLALTMVKEGWDDYKRYKRDRAYNEETFKCLERSKGEFLDKQSQHIVVGDILFLEKGSRVPADLVILATKTSSGTAYLKTDQLDGETDWKVRESIKSIQSIFNYAKNISSMKFTVDVPRPSNKIYDFRGTIRVENEKSEPLRLQNTAWASTTLAAGDIFGLVVYVQKDTRIQMNANKARIKFPTCDYEINNLSKMLFVLCISLSFFLVALKGFSGRWIVEWILFLVLLCCIIPQSLRTNLDVVKLIYTYRVNSDPDIPGTLCRNSLVNEDLGRINHVLSDKTGTLTQNVMIFKKITTGIMHFSEEDFGELKRMIEGPHPFMGEKFANKKSQEAATLMYCMMLCNNVQPCLDNDGNRFLQSSSPDEIALAEFAESLGFFIENRDRETLVLREPSPGSFPTEYIILDLFPFSSSRKRMGVILKIKSTGKIIFFLKGADTIVKERVSRNADVVVEEADNLAKEGLRTLAFCYKVLDQQDYDDWKDRHYAVTTNINATEDDEDRVIAELEQGMTFTGISGVEDLLQENVRDTIESLREGNIKVWVLTGDKVETAKCIARATGLKQKQENFFEMVDEDIAKIENQIFQLRTRKDVLIVQGNVLGIIYDRGLDINFFANIKHFHAIMFCRCSPTQKAQIVKSVQTVCGSVVCSIGDGGNDVSMIQQADIGIGIEGKEGLQAAMSSDFSITKFKYIKDLLFWHGRRATLSTAYVTLFVIHRGLIIALIQFCFSLYFYLVPISFYNANLIIAYTVVYLVLPVVATVEDVTKYHALSYPKLYLVCQQSKLLNWTSFLSLTWKSLYQACIIFLFASLWFDNTFLKIITISFSALVFTELLNIFTLVDRLNKWILGANAISLLFYIISAIFFREALGLQPLNFDTLKKIFLIVCLCWVPFELLQLINRTFFPTVTDKIMQTVKKNHAPPTKLVMESELKQTDGTELLNSNRPTEII